MARDILKEIVDRRVADMQRLGIQFGHDVPAERTRPVHPFLSKKGVILEVKRASPSKGDIAPDLVAGDVARSYAEAGAQAISCLTETNYFKGTLADLMEVCAAVDRFEQETGRMGPAVLRKDFIISPEEVDVAYRAGADAVLLISRILDTATMTSMALKCQELGMTALVELRLEEDVAKLSEVLEHVDARYLVAGVNSRDLRDFTIDLLAPCAMKESIERAMKARSDSAPRVIFESGIRTPESARFVGSLGFAGLLLGEAAARNPEIRVSLVRAFTEAAPTANAAFWNSYASGTRGSATAPKAATAAPKAKICGLTTLEDALNAARLGASFLGFIFWNHSPRHASVELVRKVRSALAEEKLTPVLVGVIVNPEDSEAQEAIQLVEDGTLDVLQLHTMNCARAFLQTPGLVGLPHYAAVNVSSPEDVACLDQLFEAGEPRVLVDALTEGKIGGTGRQISPELVALVQKKYRLWLAGGLSPENVRAVKESYAPELVDCASGVEARPGIKDQTRLTAFFEQLKS